MDDAGATVWAKDVATDSIAPAAAGDVGAGAVGDDGR